MFRNCPYQKKESLIVHIVLEASTVNDLSRNIPRINVSLENIQPEH